MLIRNWKIVKKYKKGVETTSKKGGTQGKTDNYFRIKSRDKNSVIEAILGRSDSCTCVQVCETTFL